MQLTTLLKRILIGAVLAGVLIVIFAFMMPFASLWLSIAGGCVAAVAIFSLTALVCAGARRRGRMPTLMMTGLLASLLATIGWILISVTFPFLDYSLHHWMESLWPVSIWALTCALIGGLYMRRARSSASVIAKGITTVLGILLAVLIIVPMWFNDIVAERGFGYLRILGVVAVLAVCSGLITAIAAVLPRLRGERREVDPDRLDLTVTCPRCRATQPFHTGGSECALCGLRISVLVP